MTTSTQPASTAATQTLVIPDWHPTSSPNNQKRHWRAVQKNHHIDRDMAWASAKHAGWTFMQGRVRLTITLIYPRKYRVDADNLAARCKGLIDGLKTHVPTLKVAVPHTGLDIRRGFFFDDSTEWLDLRVLAEVRRGEKATEITLESVL